MFYMGIGKQFNLWIPSQLIQIGWLGGIIEQHLVIVRWMDFSCLFFFFLLLLFTCKSESIIRLDYNIIQMIRWLVFRNVCTSSVWSVWFDLRCNVIGIKAQYEVWGAQNDTMFQWFSFAFDVGNYHMNFNNRCFSKHHLISIASLISCAIFVFI